MKEILLANNKGITLVDDGDYELVSQHKWRISALKYTSYARANINIYMHRLILDAKKEEWVDHINHNGLDNRRENLRLCTPSQNHMNRRIIKGNSEYKGVSWDRARRKWVAYIKVGQQHINLGGFTDETEAAQAYNRAAIKYFGDFACINIVRDKTVDCQGKIVSPV